MVCVYKMFGKIKEFYCKYIVFGIALLGIEIVSVILLHDYAQQSANSHRNDGFMLMIMPIICLLAVPFMLIKGIRCIIRKEYYRAMIIVSLLIWCLCMIEAMSVSCVHCTYGG